MISRDGQEEQCEFYRECGARIRNHYWAKVKAEGWFFTKDGRAFCPDHIPEWVAAWRKKKQDERDSAQ